MRYKFLMLIGIINLLSFVSAHTGEGSSGHHGMMDGMMAGMYGWEWEFSGGYLAY